MVRIDRITGRRVYGGWPGNDPKAGIIWEAFKPESEPRRSIRQDEIEERKPAKERAAPKASGRKVRTDSDVMEDRGGIF